MMGPLVSTEWLAANLDRPELVLFDATKYLPNEGRDGPTEFAAAHIPGARFFDIDLVADPDTKLPHMVPSAGRFDLLMGEMGVSNDSIAVFYDQKGIASSARGWWLMGLFGHDAAAVLDGGLPKWLREGRPVATGPADPPAPTVFRSSLRAERLRGIGDMMAEHGDRVVIDARAAGRFAGTAPEPRPGLPSGHMPGSRNLPFNELLAPDGTMLSAEALRARFAAAGVDGSRPVVTSCGTGVTATILTLGLVQAGLPRGAVYDGSWTEWAGRPDTIKEKS
jgi:thiosulfate/3-mercaptopyruvate sulfurtransferase